MKAHEIRLAKLGEGDLDNLSRWAQSDEAYGTYDEPSRLTLPQIRAKWEKGEYAYTWIIHHGEKKVGFCHSLPHPWNDWTAILAVIIAEPTARGRGIGTEVHKRLCHTIFALQAEVQKIEAYTDRENQAEQRVLEKCGFVQEGLLRKSGLIRGEIRDMYVYGLIR